MDLLEATTTPLSTVAEQSSVTEEARVGFSDCMDGARGASPVIATTKEVANTTLKMPLGPSTTELLSKDGIEAMTPLLWMTLGFSLHIGLRGWTVLSILKLQRVQGQQVVSAPRRPPRNPRNCHRDGPSGSGTRVVLLEG